MREAVISADLDQLLAKIQEVEARDPRLAQGLRRLAEGFEYQKLLDLFGPAVADVDKPATGAFMNEANSERSQANGNLQCAGRRRLGPA